MIKSTKPTFIVSVNARIYKDGKFLLAQRSLGDKFMPGYWGTPGGKMEQKEGRDMIRNTIKREVMEEVGIEIHDTIHPLGNLVYEYVAYWIFYQSFVCDRKNGAAKVLEDTHDVKRLTIEEIEKLTPLLRWTKEELPLLKQHLTS